MIQRIQSIQLLLSALLMLSAYLIPYWSIQTDSFQYIFFIHKFQQMNIKNQIILIEYYPYCLVGILAGISIILSFYIIFQYKNRNFQIKLNIINVMILISCISLSIYFSHYYHNTTLPYKISSKANSGFFWPIISIILLKFAHKNIQQDEAMVRNSDRIL